MDPSQVWALVAFMSVTTAALISLELGMRRAQARRLPDSSKRRVRGDR
jgi:hypothetical protein